MLTSRQPIWIGWGKDLIKLYNDPYKTIVGGKHPWALGKPASVVWKDIWKDIDPMLREVMLENQGTYSEAQLLIMERNGYPEETYYTFSYTPIAGDEGTTEGMICANVDDTDRIISERQLKTLTQLGKSLTDEKPDVIFLDLNMPAMSGWQCLAKLKNDTALKNIPVIMYSTSSNPREKEIAIELGATGFVTKPTDFGVLTKILETISTNLNSDLRRILKEI